MLRLADIEREATLTEVEGTQIELCLSYTTESLAGRRHWQIHMAESEIFLLLFWIWSIGPELPSFKARD